MSTVPITRLNNILSANAARLTKASITVAKSSPCRVPAVSTISLSRIYYERLGISCSIGRVNFIRATCE